MNVASRDLELPCPGRVLGTGILGVVLFVLLRLFADGGSPPYFWPLAATGLTVAFLFTLGLNRDPVRSFVRTGFHLGAFAFFMFYPLIDSENVGAGVPPSLRDTIGWMLVLTVIGFEFGYWGTRISDPVRRHAAAFEPTARQRKHLAVTIYIGLAAWFLTLLDSAISADVSMVDMLLTMRGHIEGAREDAAPLLGGGLILLQRLLASGGFLAATAASVLLTSRHPSNALTRLVCWGTLSLCAVAGFLTGSRGIFFYSLVPLVVTCWLLWARSTMRSARWFLAICGLVVIVGGSAAMSALRGGDIRTTYDEGLEVFSAEQHARGALDIYSQLSLVVQGFPEVIPYQRGRSLVPLVLGWVPRAIWEDKPYPFSLFMNFLNGESLERRAASLAVGIPGEGYGNFGLVGVFLWAALAGFAGRRADDYIGNFHPDHPLRLVLATMGAIWMALIVRGGIPEMFYMGLAALLLPWALSVYLSRACREPADQTAESMAVAMSPHTYAIAQPSWPVQQAADPEGLPEQPVRTS
jgi:oligosaccharide repeat unit polymerase